LAAVGQYATFEDFSVWQQENRKLSLNYCVQQEPRPR